MVLFLCMSVCLVCGFPRLYIRADGLALIRGNKFQTDHELVFFFQHGSSYIDHYIYCVDCLKTISKSFHGHFALLWSKQQSTFGPLLYYIIYMMMQGFPRSLLLLYICCFHHRTIILASPDPVKSLGFQVSKCGAKHMPHCT